MGKASRSVRAQASIHRPASSHSPVWDWDVVVDDDASAQELLHSMLERSGYEVREAPDGRAGLRGLYAAGSPELKNLVRAICELRSRSRARHSFSTYVELPAWRVLCD